jgi:pimeloyl-ACP methyl ester carboxylesterase
VAAEAALAFLQSQPEIDATRSVVVGHSDGSVIAMQICHDLQGKAGSPAGLVLLGAPGRPGGGILREQIAASLKRAGLTADQARPYMNYVDLALSQIDKDGTIPPHVPAGFEGLFPVNAAKLLRVELKFDPTKIVPVFQGPVLVVQGEKDIQISVTRDTPLLVAALKARRSGTVEVQIAPSASHQVKNVANENVEPGVSCPVVSAALDAIASWMKKHFQVS